MSHASNAKTARVERRSAADRASTIRVGMHMIRMSNPQTVVRGCPLNIPRGWQVYRFVGRSPSLFGWHYDAQSLACYDMLHAIEERRHHIHGMRVDMIVASDGGVVWRRPDR